MSWYVWYECWKGWNVMIGVIRMLERMDTNVFIWYRLGLILYLILILGYECHDRRDTNVEKDGYECYIFDIGWVWFFIWYWYLDTNVMIGLIRMLKGWIRMLFMWYRLGFILYLILILGYECHDRRDTNVEKDGYECYIFDIGWVWFFIWSWYLDTNVMIGVIWMLKRIDTNVIYLI